ncbi:hypothetical protein SUGI_1087700 [Cryptomeria japonica]|uniref:aspartyl protease family protein 2-like n=1 Tax=Cryptomeria japonica TaxID=3369 RepID=UPI0024146EEB|nr:aspartyl protease family protein 2-like [Cryptomeria japonica]GLJ51093.1 hypothetical protein SUGI_1087700 [Cryptomeria japonica]
MTSNRIRIPRVAMGCSTRHKGPNVKGADGILGLGQGSISFPSQIGHLYGDKFSYCFPSHGNSTSSTSTYLVFSDRSLDHLKSDLGYTPFLKNPPGAPDTFYYIGIEGIKINGKRLPIPRSIWLVDRLGSGGSIVDFGTTLTYLLQPSYGILLAAFERLVIYPRISLDPFDLCFNSFGLENLRLPEFSIEFAGSASFRPPVDNYFIHAAPKIRCLGIVSVPPLFGVNLIGNMMHQNFFIEFDRRNSRFGFARTN